jgi:hypothetical protein
MATPFQVHERDGEAGQDLPADDQLRGPRAAAAAACRGRAEHRGLGGLLPLRDADHGGVCGAARRAAAGADVPDDAKGRHGRHADARGRQDEVSWSGGGLDLGAGGVMMWPCKNLRQPARKVSNVGNLHGHGGCL